MQKAKDKSMIETGRVLFVSISQIRPNPGQPRRVFDKESLTELAASIGYYGVLQPISVRRRQNGYELIAGERRLRAAKIAGLTEIPCIVMTMDEEMSGMLALVENLQRQDLDYIEEAEGISRLMRLYGLSQEQAAQRLGKSQSAVANKLRLLRHSETVLNALRENRLTERHARALLRLSSEAERLAAIEVIAKREMTVARAENYIDSLLAEQEEQKQGTRKLLVKDIRLFLNSIHHNLEVMKSAGISAQYGREENDEEIILTIRVPKRPA